MYNIYIHFNFLIKNLLDMKNIKAILFYPFFFNLQRDFAKLYSKLIIFFYK